MSDKPQDLAEAPEELPTEVAEWPTREQMERVQEMAAGGETLKVERVSESDVMKVTTGLYGTARYFNADGEDVTADETYPSAIEGVAIPLDLARAILTDEIVDEALDEALGAAHPGYRLGNRLGDALMARLKLLVDEHGQYKRGDLRAESL